MNWTSWVPTWVVAGLLLYIIIAQELRISREWPTWSRKGRVVLLLVCVGACPLLLLLYVWQVTRERGYRYARADVVEEAETKRPEDAE